MDIVEKIENVLSESKWTRMGSTYEQENAIRKLEIILKSLKVNINGGTTIGKAPQTVILYTRYQGSEIYINSDGEVEISTKKVKPLNRKNIEDILSKANLLPGQGVKSEGTIEEKLWSADVNTKWEAPEGLFTKSADEIADVLAKNSKDLKQAMARLEFYLNRAGKNLNATDKKRLNSVEGKLRKKFN